MDSSDDVGGGISNDFMTTGNCGPSGASPWAYTYNGNLTGSNKITFSDANGITLPHYQIKILFGMILIDSWQGSDVITATLNGLQPKTTARGNRQTF